MDNLDLRKNYIDDIRDQIRLKIVEINNKIIQITEKKLEIISNKVEIETLKHKIGQKFFEIEQKKLMRLDEYNPDLSSEKEVENAMVEVQEINNLQNENSIQAQKALERLNGLEIELYKLNLDRSNLSHELDFLKSKLFDNLENFKLELKERFYIGNRLVHSEDSLVHKKSLEKLNEL